MYENMKYHIGIDEAGRGPLAGPVAVGGVMISETLLDFVLGSFKGLRDSKQLSEKKREEFYERMLSLQKEHKLLFAVGLVSHETIDARGIVSALRSGVGSVLEKIGVDPEKSRVLLDGSLSAPVQYTNQKTIIRGDETEPIISLASIAAKVVRDRKMRVFAKQYPLYGFERHKGYGTKAHYEALMTHGISLIHRRSFLKNLPEIKK